MDGVECGIYHHRAVAARPGIHPHSCFCDESGNSIQSDRGYCPVRIRRNSTYVPQSGDWFSGAWDTDTTNILYPYVAKCLIRRQEQLPWESGPTSSTSRLPTTRKSRCWSRRSSRSVNHNRIHLRNLPAEARLHSKSFFAYSEGTATGKPQARKPHRSSRRISYSKDIRCPVVQL